VDNPGSTEFASYNKTWWGISNGIKTWKETSKGKGSQQNNKLINDNQLAELKNQSQTSVGTLGTKVKSFEN